jgi:hypothetical protein
MPSTKSGRDRLTDIKGDLRGETEKAYRFATTDHFMKTEGALVVWLPKSQVEWDADTRTMTMPEWLAIERELV